MTEKERLSRRQVLFIRMRLLARPIKECAKLAGISERCAYYWLADPAFQAEYARYEEALSEIEFEEIKRLSVKSIQASYYAKYKY